MLDDPREIAQRLRGLRATYPGISNKRLADAAGVSPQAVSQWFRTGKISKKSWAAVMSAYGVGPDLVGPDAVRDDYTHENQGPNSISAKYARLPHDAQMHIEALMDILLEK